MTVKNATLWKRVLNEGIVCRSVDTPRDYLDKIADEIITYPIIVDSRPRDEWAEEGRAWRWHQYNRMSIPFPRFWVEGATDQLASWGCTVRTKSHPEIAGGWAMWVTMFYTRPSFPVAMCGSILAEIDAQGDLVTAPFDEDRLVASIPKAHVEALGAEVAAHSLFTGLDNLLDLLQLLGCKNVGLEPRENDPAQVRRAVKRHGNNSNGYRYHVLTVRPPGAKTSAKGEEVGTMPRHVCRGHFAEYGPEFGKGLLFGKYAGRFFVPPHLKGKKENGVVEKDYAVTA